jgi:hypothetical protein
MSHLDEWLKQSTEELAVAEADLQAAQQRVTELRTIQDGIRLAQQRYGQQDLAEPAASESRPAKAASNAGRRTRRKTASKTAKRPHTGHSTLCYDTLVELGGRTSTTEVTKVLLERGYDIDSEQVRNSFAYLVRKGQVERVEAGVWSLATTPADNDSRVQTLLDSVDPDAVPQSTM